MIETFFSSLMIGYSGAMMPGSLLTYTIDKSMKAGPKSGFIISLGHSLLELVLVLLLLKGAGRYLSTQTAQTIIGLAGGLVLGYLGFDMVRNALGNKLKVSFETGKSAGHANLLAGGVLISATNPYFIFWWAVVGFGMIMSAYKAFGLMGVALFYLGHILSDITWYSFVSVLVSNSRRFLGGKVYKTVIILLGVCLLGFGAKFIYGAISQLL